MTGTERRVRLDEFDGFRLFGMLIIMASHTQAFHMTGIGIVYAYFFLVLSGFFAVSPLKRDGEERYLHPKNWFKFYLLRFLRIVPLMWSVILVFWWLGDDTLRQPGILKNALLLRFPVGHLWFIQHELIGLLFVPPILFVIYLLKRFLKLPNAVIGILLMAGGIFLSHYMFQQGIWLYWNGPDSKRLLSSQMMLIGMGAGYLVKAFGIRKKPHVALDLFLDVLVVLLLFYMTIYQSGWFQAVINGGEPHYYAISAHPLRLGLEGTALILLLTLNRFGLIPAILRIPAFARFGRASLGIYLIHYYLIRFMLLDTPKNWILLVLITLPCALFLYENVEAPVYRWVKKKINF